MKNYTSGCLDRRKEMTSPKSVVKGLQMPGCTGMVPSGIKARPVHLPYPLQIPTHCSPPGSGCREREGFGGVVTHFGNGSPPTPHPNTNPLACGRLGSHRTRLILSFSFRREATGLPQAGALSAATVRWINTLTQLWSFSPRTDAEQDFPIQSILVFHSLPLGH